MSNFLVTGIAGFIGSSLAHALLESGHSVRGIDNLSTGRFENISDISDRIDFRRADLLDLDAVHDACRDIDFVLHEAALPSVPRSIKDPISSNRSNAGGTLNLLVAARDAKVKRVVYASSSSLYGDTPTLPKQEAMAPDPISPYAVAKLTGEYYMRSFYRVYGLETVSIRYFNVFGPRQDPTSMYSGVLSVFITRMLRGEQPTIYGDGEQSRDFTYIDNVVSGNLLACNAPAKQVAGRYFNVATGSRATLNYTYSVLQKLTNFNRPPRYAPPRNGDIQHSHADISLAQRHLGYKPLVTFEQGLSRTVEWYKNATIGAATLAQ
ncbi:MAG TPA: SDR family oxidoreductase [Terriglobales bacterium]|nr:SDR family oxidoreductase [Terriglobales bacterium]